MTTFNKPAKSTKNHKGDTAVLLHRYIPPPIYRTQTLSEQPVIFAIRTDATDAADTLIRKLFAHVGHITPFNTVVSKVKDAYRIWSNNALQAFSDHMDHTKYGLHEPTGLNVDLHNAKHLSDKAIENAWTLAEPYHKQSGMMPLLISLDGMIASHKEYFAEIAFSRLFDFETGKEKGFVQRPGKKPLSEQLAHILKLVKAEYMAINQGDSLVSNRIKTFIQNRKNSNIDEDMSIVTRKAHEYEPKVPIVFLEDNVRRAKMLNWIIKKMDEVGIFQYATVAGISTCFCNASKQERQGIIFKGKVVPVVPVIDYGDSCPIDVTTTRDLMFDGFVLDIDGSLARLPGIFTDVVERFKIAPAQADQFRRDIAIINKNFCEQIEKEFDVSPPLEWFDTGLAIAYFTHTSLDTPMVETMNAIIDSIPDNCLMPLEYVTDMEHHTS